MHEKLPSRRCEELRTTVADLIEDWGVSVYPFSIWSLIRRMGIRIVRYSVLPGWLREEIEHYWPFAIAVYPPDYDPSRTIVFYNDKRKREQIRLLSLTSSLISYSCILTPENQFMSTRRIFSQTIFLFRRP